MVCLNPAPVGSLLKNPAAKSPPKAQRTSSVRDEKHLAAIRKCPCVKCGETVGIDAAHVRKNSAAHGKFSGGAMKPDDRWTVPLCREHHEEQHKVGEPIFWHALGIEPLRLAERLYAVSPHIEQMTAVVVQVGRESRS